jgi:hypothetical protein
MRAAASRKVAKWTLIVGGVLFVALVIASFTSLGNGGKTASKGSKGSHAAGLGETVVLRDVAFTITHARTAKRLPSFPGQTARYSDRAKGIFVRVSISLKNVGVMPATGTIADSTFFGGNGKTYSPDSSKNSTFSELQRGFSGRGWLVFDVSPEAVRGGRFVLLECGAPLLDEPIQRCGTARIDLGLR